ncbi:hypothetical protein [Azospirillum sp.]|uniref:hypothetical protein n=1 Tax=Azospirillum sp. TaxID=34012 RepID=UPI002D2D1C2E|nr:hypothetical protein [Azospirillum sp.]HYD70487.1 hypothetical protein [Azospirillum sp.]
MRIGIDFDNTIAGYDAVFALAAREAGLAPAEGTTTKRQVRDAARRRPDGERVWMGLQGQVYGRLMPHAALIDGVAMFLRRARAAGATVFVVSHKTEHGHFDPARVNLREAARAWMEARGFFRADGFALPRDAVFFEATRADKIARIAALACDHFIDDLEEVLGDPAFPAATRRHLFAPDADPPPGPFTVHRHWSAIAHAILG